MPTFNARQSLESQILERNPMNVKTTKGLQEIKPTKQTHPCDQLVYAYLQKLGYKQEQTSITNNLNEIAELILSCIDKLNFEEYVEAQGVDPKKYTVNQIIKFPKSVIILITCDYLIRLLKIINYPVGQITSTDNKDGYIFNGKYWQPFSNDWLRNLLKNTLIRLGYNAIESQTTKILKDLIEQFWVQDIPLLAPNKERVLINLNNTTLEILADGNVMQHPFNSDIFLQYCLPYEYNPQSKTILFEQYLNRVLPDKESQVVLQELLGSIFIKHINLEKIGILLGSGSNGKSVLLKIITHLLGNDNISQMDLKSLTTDNNADNNRYHLMGKLLNFAPEINAKGEQSHDLIKRMASGEAIQVKRLYKDTVTITDYAKLIFNANQLPDNVEISHGFFRRFLIVGFDQTIGDDEKDPDLANKIIATELSGVLNWIIEGTKRLQVNKKFSFCQKSEELLNSYKLESNIVALWIEENNYNPHTNKTKSLKEIMRQVNEFAIEHGYKGLSSRTIAYRLRNLGFITNKPKGSGTLVYISH